MSRSVPAPRATALSTTSVICLNRRSRAFEALRQLAGRDACQDPRIANDNMADASVDAGRIQMPLE